MDQSHNGPSVNYQQIILSLRPTDVARSIWVTSMTILGGLMEELLGTCLEGKTILATVVCTSEEWGGDKGIERTLCFQEGSSYV